MCYISTINNHLSTILNEHTSKMGFKRKKQKTNLNFPLNVVFMFNLITTNAPFLYQLSIKNRMSLDT